MGMGVTPPIGVDFLTNICNECKSIQNHALGNAKVIFLGSLGGISECYKREDKFSIHLLSGECLCSVCFNKTENMRSFNVLKFIIIILLIVNASREIKAKYIQNNALSSIAPINSTTVMTTDSSSMSSWIKQMRKVHQALKGCEKSLSFGVRKNSTWYCVKTASLQLFENISSRAIIPLWHGIRFVRTPLPDDGKQERVHQNAHWSRKDIKYLTWFDRVAGNATTKDLSNLDAVGTARHRRHRYNMMMTMMFGVTAFGAVVVPMGFQLLSIVSGKALLLAKMALLLASINGLKRVANSGLHYGLYHTPSEHYGSYYDRGDVHHPRNVPNLTPIVQPLELL
uniref:Uncharacterized protein n=1 Tax=Glossina austeni TaxID=7395 RepID=A0A1A9VVI5_GLOAU